MLLKVIRADLYRYVPRPYSLTALTQGFRSQGFRYLFFKRVKDHYGAGHIIGFMASLFVRRYMYKYGFQIGGSIGEGFYIGHFGTIVVSTLAVIGKNCNIAHGVTVGAARRGSLQGAPAIGNYVWMGTNAVIVGKITIGDDVLIAPGAYVNKDIPSHSIVIGNPAQVIAKENATEGYINNLIDGSRS
jgi:serine O-acetyltransferase